MLRIQVRQRTLAVPAIALALLFASSAQAGRAERRTLRAIAEQPAPGLDHAHVIHGDGDRWDSDSFEGKVTIVNFWATWCPPCLEELPLLQAFHDRHAGDGGRVVGLTKFFQVESGDRTPEQELDEIRELLDRHGASYPVLVAEDEAAWAAYSAEGVPVTILIGRDGLPVAVGMGIQGTRRVLNQAEAMFSK